MSQNWLKRTDVAQLFETALVCLAKFMSHLGSKTAASGKATVMNSLATEYEAWRRQFLRNRLRIALWLGMTFVLSMVIFFVWVTVAEAKGFKTSYFLSSAAVTSCLLICYWLNKTPLGRRYPGWLFLGFSWSLTIVTQTSVALSGVTTLMKPLWMIVFIIQATVIPVRWSLHVASHLSAYICYLAVNAALGLSLNRPLLKHVAEVLPLFWVCFACVLSVYLYERLQRTEFSSRKELEIAYQTIEAAEAKYRSIFENALEGIFQSPPEGGYIIANPALARIYGFASPEELSKSLTDIQHQLFVDPDRYQELMQLMQQQGGVSDFEAQVYHTDGSAIWICINAREVRDEKDTLLYYQGLIEDITDRKRSAEALRAFFHAVSHDLRNPITGTLMVLKNLQQQSGETISLPRRILDRMIQSSDRQLDLINTLLEAHVSEVQGVILHKQPIQLSQLVQSVVAELEPILEQNQATLKNLIPEDLPLVSADPTALWRVFGNLINNALKHNPPGLTLILNATVERQIIRCCIEDNGVGLTQEQCDRLFDLYFRSSQTRSPLSLGLGLYLCRQIIAAHGGEIGAIGSPGAGATFWFTLPIDSSSRAADEG
jgi:PAS domain S-box-containing protein